MAKKSVEEFDKTSKMVPEEVPTPEFLNKALPEETIKPEDPEVNFVDGTNELSEDVPPIVVDEDGYLHFNRPVESLWLKSRGGVEYQIFATDHGLAVLGRGKLVALLADDEPAVDVNPTIKATNREKEFKLRRG